METVYITSNETIRLKQGESIMPVVYSEEDNARIPKLPKWAQELLERQKRVIERFEKEIESRDFKTKNTQKVTFRGYGSRDDVALDDKTEVTFNLMDSIMKGREHNYRHRHSFDVKIKEDIETGGEMLEIYYTGDDAYNIVPHARNIFYLRPNDACRKDFVGFKNHNEKFTDEDRTKGRDDVA